VAFANTDSGQLIIGVSKTRQIVGVRDADKVMQRLDQISVNNCEPPLTIIQETIATENGFVIVVNIPKGDQRPYRTNRGDYFIRATSGRRRASRQELLRLFQSTETLYYDEMPVLRATLTDIDASAFENYIRRSYQRPLEELGIRYEDLLKNLGYLREQDGRFFPTLTCVLFFGREPQRFFPHAHLVAARIPGTDYSFPPSDNKLINGALPTMLEDAARFLRIHLPTAHRIQGFEPEAHPELPEEALREILVNALAHRDYTILAPVRVFVLDDRVEIRTPGELPNTVTIEAIRLGAAHVLRNPTIYILFSRLGLVTGIGTGIYRAIQQIQELTQKELRLFLEGNEFVVSIPRTRQEK
jgi:ATP-dependent DNA helicase RecG